MKTQHALEDIKVNVKLKLVTLWASFMFLYVYVDHLHLYMPGKIADIMQGRVFTFDLTEGFLLAVLASMIVPTLMIFLSVALPAPLNRRANLVLATVYIPYMLFNLTGEAWPHMVLGAMIEVGLLCLIVRYAWKWPRVEE